MKRDDYLVHEEDFKGLKIKIYQDTDPINPREDCDQITNMVIFHRRYNLGDKHNFSDPEDLQEFLKQKNICSLPIFMYEHSGIAINTGGFPCPWDSGQIGYIYMSAEVYKENWSKKRVNKKHIYEILDLDVKVYNDYLTGNCYNFVIEDQEGNNLDSCSGFLGDYEKYCLPEARSSAEYQRKQIISDHVKYLKNMIKNHVPFEKREPCPMV